MSSETSTPVRRGPFMAVRERLSGRSDSEHVQALVRIVIACIGGLYVMYLHLNDKLHVDPIHVSQLAFVIISGSLAIFMLIVIQPQASHLRRHLGMVFDFSMVSYFMHLMEDYGIVFFPVYLWVTIGNGLRYGERYLYVAMSLSIISFTLVLANSVYWREQWGFSIGLLVGLIALPVYFSILLKQLEKQHDELKKLYQQTARHATHDSLTNLPNRKHFYDQLTETISFAKQEGQRFAVLYLDLDGFKAINDDLGHAAGDHVIESSARRIEKCVRKADTVARVGGDEFVVILRDIASEDAVNVAGKIIESLGEPFIVTGRNLRITASIGVAAYPYDGEDVNTLIHSADSAMYEAKRSGKNGYQVYRREKMPLMILASTPGQFRTP